MKKLAILGSGDLGKLIAYHAADSGFNVVGFFDDFTSEQAIDGIPILGKSESIQEKFCQNIFSHLIIAIGYKHLKERGTHFKKWKGVIPFANIIHSSSYSDSSVNMGEGIVILPGCTLDKGVVLEDNVLLNTGVTIAHDSHIGFNTFIGPGATLAGFISIGHSCFIGVGTIIIDNIKLGDEIQTGGGSVIVRNFDRKGLYVGVPARFVK